MPRTYRKLAPMRCVSVSARKTLQSVTAFDDDSWTVVRSILYVIGQVNYESRTAFIEAEATVAARGIRR